VKVAYVVVNERPGSGLLRTQVLSLLKEMKRSDSRLDLRLLAFWQPWVAFKFRAEIRRMRADLAQAGVRQLDYPWAIFPFRHFLYQPWLFPMLHAWVRGLLSMALRTRYDVVHCRGYVPAYAATELKSKYGHRVVFDLRSLWAKEHITIGAWREGDPIDRMWKRIEARTLSESDASIGVSSAMVEEMRAIAPDSNSVYVPICVDLQAFSFDAAARARLRAELGWGTQPVIAYQGSLGLMNSNLAEVAEYFAVIRKSLPAVRFLVLTSNRTVNIPEMLARYGIAPDTFAVRHPRQSELAAWLSVADAGIHAMSPGPDSATRLGVKVVEYLSCGLPLIVNEHVGAAADLVRRYGVGVVANIGDPAALAAQLTALFSRTPMPAESSRSLARELFSVESCARRYTALYSSITSRGGGS
jgi:glycosyltransferase involved in cell wall biosynthesis